MKYDPKKHHRRSIRLQGYDYSQAGAYFITICCQNMVCRFGEIVPNVPNVGAGLAPAQNPEQSQIVPDSVATMQLNEYGQIAYNEWGKLAERYSNFELDVFQIMPNHMHGIIVLNDSVGAGFTPDPHSEQSQIVPNAIVPDADVPDADVSDAKRAGASPAPTTTTTTTTTTTVFDIVGAYKSLVANECLKIWKSKWGGDGIAPLMGKLWQRNYYEHIIRDEQAYQRISQYIINNPAKWWEDKFYKK